MIYLKHIGIYVENMEKMLSFYERVFKMHVIQKNLIQKDYLAKDILKDDEGAILVSKLITDRGKETGIGEMIELLYVDKGGKSCTNNLYNTGCMHIAFPCKCIEKLVEEIESLGGKQATEIHQIGINKCCFCRDPEGNWLELIENNADVCEREKK